MRGNKNKNEAKECNIQVSTDNIENSIGDFRNNEAEKMKLS